MNLEKFTQDVAGWVLTAEGGWLYVSPSLVELEIKIVGLNRDRLLIQNW